MIDMLNISLLRQQYHVIELDQHFVEGTNEIGQIVTVPLTGELPVVRAQRIVAIKDESQEITIIEAIQGKAIVPMFDVDIIVDSGTSTDLDVEAAYDKYYNKQVEIENQFFESLKGYSGRGVLFIRNFTVMPHDTGGWRFTNNIGTAKII